MPKNRLLKAYNFPDRAVRNLGTFNTHCMDEHARDIFFHYAGVNAVDSHAYPEMELIKTQCATFMLELMNAKNNDDFCYFTTSGSSESVLLSMLVLKAQHQRLNEKRKFEPNIIIGVNSHIAWYKAAKYLGVNLRIAVLNSATLTMVNTEVVQLIDAGTIGICCTLGAPTTLLCDDVLDLDTRLKHYHRATGQFIPIHVDAASGGFVLPFINPDLPFDFRLKHVHSINISSHKYGLVYPSLGWLLMRYTPCLEELLDESGYLGVPIKQFSVQFSHSASHLMAQYYYIQTLGHAGYKKIITKLFDRAEQLKKTLIHTQKNIQFIENDSARLPGLVFSIGNVDMLYFSQKLKEKNWSLPVYSLPNVTSLYVARVVIRYGYDDTLIEDLVSDMRLCMI